MDGGVGLQIDRRQVTDHRVQCPHCGERFNSPRAFSLHRTGPFTEERICLSVEQMVAKGMRRNAQGRWLSIARNGAHLKP